MIHNVVFHADVDGIVSAALYLKYDINKPVGYRLHPVLSSYRNEKFVTIINDLKLSEEDKLAIFDFEYNKRADLWVDHHPSKDMGYHAISTKKIVYNPSVESTAQLVFNYLKDSIPADHVPRLESLIKDTNMIDSALYPSVNFIFNAVTPMMIIRAYIEKSFPSDMMFSRIVETLVRTNFELDKTISVLNLDTSCVTELCDNVMHAKQFMEVYNKISLIRQRRIGQFPRYAENFIRPDVKYNVRVSAIGNKKWQLQLAYNKFSKEKNDLNIGRFIANLDYMAGGGRYDVGGGNFREDILDKFLEDLFKVTHNEEVVDMEKYGVDKEGDKFEKKAQDMVKEGSAKDLDEAREKVDKEEKVDVGDKSVSSSS